MSKRKRILIIVGIVIAVLIALYVVGQLRTYSDFTVEKTTERSDAQSTNYVEFGDYFLKYGSDGASCVDADNNTIWSQSYEIDQPIVVVNGDCAAIAERNGRQIYVFNTSGYQGQIDTTQSILQIDIASQETVAAVLEEDGVYYLGLYDQEGNELAKGTIHMENSGYPVSISLSNDAKKMAVSFLNVMSGTTSTTIAFYNFDSVGQNEIDNIVSSFTYEDLVIPKVKFLTNNVLVAFGDTELQIYKGSEKPDLQKQITLDHDIDSIFYGNGKFGIVYKNDITSTDASSDAEQTGAYQIVVYSKNGNTIFSKDFDLSYKSIKILSNGEVCILGENACEIFSKFGLERFHYTFNESLLEIRALGSMHTYEVILDGHTDKIRLK